MNPISSIERALADALAMVEAVRDEDLTKPTPCTRWDVRALIAHMTETCRNFAKALGCAPGDDDEADLDVRRAFRRAALAMSEGWRAPGALDTTLEMPWGPLPAALGERIAVGDLLFHTWDLARALGKPYTMPEDLAAVQLETMQRFYDPARRGPDQAFDVPIACPDDAPVADRLIAFSGRRP